MGGNQINIDPKLNMPKPSNKIIAKSFFVGSFFIQSPPFLFSTPLCQCRHIWRGKRGIMV